jgi:hypothetical protein
MMIVLFSNIILPVILYGRGTWSVTPREEHKPGVCDKRVMRMFGPKREEGTGGWRRLHNEKLHNLYASQGGLCGRGV